MNLAVNYSTQTAELLQAGRIEFDLFKTPDWPHLIEPARRLRPTYVHFPLRAGRGDGEETPLDRMERLLGETETHHVNLHLAPKASAFGVDLHSRRRADADRLIDAMLRDIEPVAKRFGPERVALENLPWAPAPKTEIPAAVLLAETIHRVLDATGCRFLLDIAHAVIAARHFEIDPRAYMASLPVDRLLEVHVSGLKQDAGGAWIDHHAMTRPDWESTEWAVGRITRGDWPRPWVMTFEYGGVGPAFAERSETAVLAEQVPRLLALSRLPGGSPEETEQAERT